MSEEMKRRLEKANRKILEKTEIIRLSRLSLRSALGLGEPYRDKLFDKQGQLMKNLQKRRNQNQEGIPAPPKVQERFSSRPRLLDFFMKSKEPAQTQQPVQEELTREETMIVNEHRKELLARAKMREEEEKREQERIEDAKARERYEQTMSVNQN